MNRRAALLAGAAAAGMGYYFAVARPPGLNAYLIFYLGTPAVALAFLAAGLAAWLRWPSSRLGLLFSLVGYLSLLPAFDYLDNAAGFTFGNLAVPLSGAALAHLGLAWPGGRLRSRFERAVVVAEYVSAAGFSLLSMVFWDPAYSGCDARCPANLLLVHGSLTAWDTVNEVGAAVNAALAVVVVTLILRHWHTARGWSRQAMAPLAWIAVVIGVETLVTDVTGLFYLPPLANLIFNGWASLVTLLGPVLFVIATVRARTAGGALGTAIVDLEPGAPPALLRDALARALGDSTLQLAFLPPGGDGYADTAGLPVDPARPGPGRAVAPLATGGTGAAGDGAARRGAAAAGHADAGARHGARPRRRGRPGAGRADRLGREGGQGGADRAARAGPAASTPRSSPKPGWPGRSRRWWSARRWPPRSSRCRATGSRR